MSFRYCSPLTLSMAVAREYADCPRELNLIFIVRYLGGMCRRRLTRVVMLLALQSMVCLISLLAAKNFRVVSFRDFNIEEARKCTPSTSPLLTSTYITNALCRVTNLLSPRPNDLHLRQSITIHLHPNLHNLQKPHYNPHRLR